MAGVETPQLRPLGVGDIVDRVFSLYRTKPVLYLVVSAIPYLIFVIIFALIVATLAVTLVGRSLAGDPTEFFTNPDPATLAAVIVGAIILGLTNTPEFSMRGFTANPLHGATINPWDSSITCGGSSGGAGASIAAGSPKSSTWLTMSAG